MTIQESRKQLEIIQNLIKSQFPDAKVDELGRPILQYTDAQNRTWWVKVDQIFTPEKS